MHAQEQRIFELIEPAVSELGYELLGVELRQRSRRSLLRLYIDQADPAPAPSDQANSDHGIGVDDCERVSHAVSALLDLADPIAGEYDLEVSSPGFDRPLFREAHYLRHLGEQVRARTRVDIDGRRNFAGTLLSVEDGIVTLEDAEGQRHRLNLDEIGSARLIPQW
ncbi:MAG: ribosome maturation factor RimP [Gammaproteobacteria bacterium]|nr:ribosome maturation factor RimP [Gammaproteobacteria bacterium]